jgi:ABC-type enterobactin transport system permease subunit
MDHVWLALPLIGLGLVLLATLTRGLEALTLGEDAAQALGINLTRLRLTLVGGTAAVVGASTAVAGTIVLLMQWVIQRFVLWKQMKITCASIRISEPRMGSNMEMYSAR